MTDSSSACCPHLPQCAPARQPFQYWEDECYALEALMVTKSLQHPDLILRNFFFLIWSGGIFFGRRLHLQEGTPFLPCRSPRGLFKGPPTQQHPTHWHLLWNPISPLRQAPMVDWCFPSPSLLLPRDVTSYGFFSYQLQWLDPGQHFS